MVRRYWLLAVFALLASVDGCSCGASNGSPTDGGGVGPDGSLVGYPDGSVVLGDGAVQLPDGAVVAPPTDGGWGVFPDGGCHPVTCQGHQYQCGDCMDNDGDGLIDAYDPNCLGPCDNNESGFGLNIPGGDTPSCARDCYYDQDQGSGNDDCAWDSRCDPLSPDSNPMCAYQDPPPPSAKCPDPQSAMCHSFCGPLTPNGCDCFGCCELPAGSGEYVFIGTLDSAGNPTCTVDKANAGDHDACHPCTPVADCLNTCGHCELCLGRTTLPPDCLPPPPVDAGTYPDGGPLPYDAGPTPDGGYGPRCTTGVQACGLPGDSPCATGYYCITGCCQPFG